MAGNRLWIKDRRLCIQDRRLVISPQGECVCGGPSGDLCWIGSGCDPDIPERFCRAPGEGASMYSVDGGPWYVVPDRSAPPACQQLLIPASKSQEITREDDYTDPETDVCSVFPERWMRDVSGTGQITRYETNSAGSSLDIETRLGIPGSYSSVFQGSDGSVNNYTSPMCASARIAWASRWPSPGATLELSVFGGGVGGVNGESVYGYWLDGFGQPLGACTPDNRSEQHLAPVSMQIVSTGSSDPFISRVTYGGFTAAQWNASAGVPSPQPEQLSLVASPALDTFTVSASFAFDARPGGIWCENHISC